MDLQVIIHSLDSKAIKLIETLIIRSGETKVSDQQ